MKFDMNPFIEKLVKRGFQTLIKNLIFESEEEKADFIHDIKELLIEYEVPANIVESLIVE